MKRNGLDFKASNCLGNATPVTAEILSKLSYGVSPTLISKASQMAVGNLNGCAVDAIIVWRAPSSGCFSYSFMYAPIATAV